MKRICFFLAWFACVCAVAQSPVEWARSLAVAPNNPAIIDNNSMAVNQFEEIAVFGIADSVSNFGIHQYGNLRFVVQDAQGALLNSRNYFGDGSVSQMIANGDHYYVAGQYIARLEFTGFDTLSSDIIVEPRSGFIGKFDRGGQPVWLHDFSEIQRGILPTSIAISPSGTLTVGTYDVTSSFGSGGESAIMQFDNNGALLSTWSMSGLPLLSAVSVNSNGSIAFAGSCAADTVYLNGQIAFGNNDYNQFYGLFDANGNLQWTKWVLDITCVMPGVYLDDTNNTYFIADAWVGDTLDSFPILPASWVHAFYVAKVNGAGAAEWVFQADDSTSPIGDASRSAERVLRGTSTGVQICGRYRGTVDWGNGVVSTATSPGEDFFTLNIGANGVAEKQISSGISNWTKQARSFSSSPSGNHTYFYVTNYDSLQLPGYLFPLMGTHAFLVKWDNTVTSVEEFKTEEIRHYPDPATEQIHLTGFESRSTVVVFSILGNELLEMPIGAGGVGVQELAPGTYPIAVRNEEGQLVYRSTFRVVR